MFRRRQNIVLAVVLSSGLVFSSIAPDTVSAAPSAEYVVKDGDYLIGIARKLGTSLAQLLAVNDLTVTSVVHPGDHLLIPEGATSPAGGGASAAAATATYTVKPGDSLFVIARKLGAPFGDLLSTNGLTDESVIFPGDQLNVPASATNPNAGAAAASTSTSTGASGTQATASYTVKSGDYLFGIAKNYDIPISTLLQLNDLTLESTLLPGATLQLPAGAVASTPPPPPADAPVGTKIDAVIAFARAQLGKPYRFNAAGPEAFDCSGLTAAAYAQIGVSLPHQSQMQSNRGVPVDWRTEDIKAGDLVFMFSSNNPGVISHVGLAINSWQWIQAPRAGDVVRLGLIPNDNVIQAVRRYVTD
ncbi:MAG: LysM peptidoglycan-binding domain-containing protein [Ilumatobacteraceae bacterium]